MLGLDNLGPNNVVQLTYYIVALVISSLTYNLLFSGISGLISYLSESRKDVEIHEYYDAI